MLSRTVTVGHETHSKMLNFIDMPSLRDIAIEDARVQLKQVFGVDYKFFIISSKRCNKESLVDKNGLPLKVSHNFNNTLLSELLDLAKQKTRSEKEPFKVKNRKFQKFYDTAFEECKLDAKIIRKLPDSDETEEIDGPTNYNLIFSLFTNMCREEFGIFETNDRRLKFRSQTKKLVKNNICLVLPPSKKNIVNIDEARKMCLVCGFLIDDRRSKECSIQGCNFKAHLKCLDICSRLHGIRLLDDFCCNDLYNEKDQCSLTLTCNEMNKINFTYMIKQPQLKRVKISRNTNRKRFINEENYCQICKQNYPLDEAHHIMHNCQGLKTVSSNKRRRLKFGDPVYVKRILEYTKMAAENFKVA